MNGRTLLHRAALLAAPLALAAAARAQTQADRLAFEVKPGTKLLKTFRTQHELRIDDMGEMLDDLPFVSSKTGGWVSSWQRVEILDEYLASDPARPLELRRTLRDATAGGKLSASRPGGRRQEERSNSTSPLRQQTIHFTWVPADGDWSRCYERVDAEEEWLDALYGEWDLLDLLPSEPVAPGATWKIAPARLRHVLAPGGDLKLVPTGENLWGRTMELGIGGDFADFVGPDAAGEVTATYKGRREVALDEAGTQKLECGVIELELNLSLRADRTELYRMAMPQQERREPARLDSVVLEYSLLGKGELLWNLAAGRFHSLHVEGQEGFVATVWKTRFDGKEQHRLGQQSRFSGPLVLESVCEDGAAVEPDKPRDNPKLLPRRK